MSDDNKMMIARHAIGANTPLKPGVGHNNPPRTVFDEVDDLYLEAQNWLDGAGVDSDEQAEALGMLMDALKSAGRICEAERKEKVAPLDNAKKEIQAVYKPYIDKVDRALDTATTYRNRWLKAKQAILDEQARLAREVAKEEKRLADEAIRASRNDLAEREKAEALLQAAKAAEHKALALAKVRPEAIGGRRTVSKKFEPVMVSGFDAATHYWQTRQGEMEAFFLSLAIDDVRAGVRRIPGFEIKEIEL